MGFWLVEATGRWHGMAEMVKHPRCTKSVGEAVQHRVTLHGRPRYGI